MKAMMGVIAVIDSGINDIPYLDIALHNLHDTKNTLVTIINPTDKKVEFKYTGGFKLVQCAVNSLHRVINEEIEELDPSYISFISSRAYPTNKNWMDDFMTAMYRDRVVVVKNTYAMPEVIDPGMMAMTRGTWSRLIGFDPAYFTPKFALKDFMAKIKLFNRPIVYGDYAKISTDSPYWVETNTENIEVVSIVENELGEEEEIKVLNSPLVEDDEKLFNSHMNSQQAWMANLVAKGALKCL